MAAILVVIALCRPDEEPPKNEVPLAEMPVEDLSDEVKRGQELIDWLRVKKDQTSLQNDAALDKFKGKKIIVRGKVRQIGKTAFGDDVYVSLTVGQIDLLERANIQFNIPGALVPQVSAWGKDEQHILRGKVKGSGDLEDDIICMQTEVVADDKFENLLHQ